MTAAGFEEASFSDEVLEMTKSLLRKYDSRWEMSTVTMEAAAAATGAGTVVQRAVLRLSDQPRSAILEDIQGAERLESNVATRSLRYRCSERLESWPTLAEPTRVL
ncbi:hypothetical protein ABZP36_036031 [Zizania latifolia]